MRAIFIALVAALLPGCNAPTTANRAVYLLLDTSGTYTEELDKAQRIVNYLLGTLDTGDSIAIARIDSGSFTDFGFGRLGDDRHRDGSGQSELSAHGQ